MSRTSRGRSARPHATLSWPRTANCCSLPLMAQRRHFSDTKGCPLSEVKRTRLRQAGTSANDPKQKFVATGSATIKKRRTQRLCPRSAIGRTDQLRPTMALQTSRLACWNSLTAPPARRPFKVIEAMGAEVSPRSTFRARNHALLERCLSICIGNNVINRLLASEFSRM